jgi:hypothetical protein
VVGDDEQERSLQRAHRLGWNSGLERYQFHNAMKATRHVTLARMANARWAAGWPMSIRRARGAPSGWATLAGYAADSATGG